MRSLHRRIPRSVRFAALLVATALLASCATEVDEVLLGETEYDVVNVPAEASERIVELAVREGQSVQSGDLIARLDDVRIALQLDAARALAEQADAALLEATRGARIESIDVARAALRRNDALWSESRTELARAEQLRKQGLIAQQAVDSAQANERRARAERDAARAELDALLHGTREEQVAQARAAAAAAHARVGELELVRSRYQLRAPRDGTVDALPFEAGDRPPLGASVARIAIGNQPYVRIFVPASLRSRVQIGDVFDVAFTGLDRTIPGHLRRIAKEPAFTPYYALAGDDASKLVYRAEIVLDEEAGVELAAGLPATARPRD